MNRVMSLFRCKDNHGRAHTQTSICTTKPSHAHKITKEHHSGTSFFHIHAYTKNKKQKNNTDHLKCHKYQVLEISSTHTHSPFLLWGTRAGWPFSNRPALFWKTGPHVERNTNSTDSTARKPLHNWSLCQFSPCLVSDILCLPHIFSYFTNSASCFFVSSKSLIHLPQQLIYDFLFWLFFYLLYHLFST